MKPILILLLLGLSGFASAQQAAQEGPSEIATMKRSVTGRLLNDRGMATGQKALIKDNTYKVVKKELGYVVVDVAGEKVSVPLVEVTLQPAPVVAIRPVVPPNGAGSTYAPPQSPTANTNTQSVPLGAFMLISAKYSLRGNQPRNVKNKIAKLAPDGEMNRPVTILVNDELCSAAALNDSYRYNVLTVIYTINGEMRTQSVGEGSVLTLP